MGSWSIRNATHTTLERLNALSLPLTLPCALKVFLLRDVPLIALAIIMMELPRRQRPVAKLASAYIFFIRILQLIAPKLERQCVGR